MERFQFKKALYHERKTVVIKSLDVLRSFFLYTTSALTQKTYETFYNRIAMQ